MKVLVPLLTVFAFVFSANGWACTDFSGTWVSTVCHGMNEALSPLPVIKVTQSGCTQITLGNDAKPWNRYLGNQSYLTDHRVHVIVGPVVGPKHYRQNTTYIAGYDFNDYLFIDADTEEPSTDPSHFPDYSWVASYYFKESTAGVKTLSAYWHYIPGGGSQDCQFTLLK